MHKSFMRSVLFLNTSQFVCNNESAFVPTNTSIHLLSDRALASYSERNAASYIFFCCSLISPRVSQRFYCFCLGSYLFAAPFHSPFRPFLPIDLLLQGYSYFFFFFLVRANFQQYIENSVADLVWLLSAAGAEQVLKKGKELHAGEIEKRCMRWWKTVNSRFRCTHS